VWSDATHLGFVFLIVTHHGFDNSRIGGGNFGHCSAVLSDVTVSQNNVRRRNVDGTSLRAVVTLSHKGERRFHGSLIPSINHVTSPPERFSDQAGVNAGV
jgi:hypothetical protein